MKGDCHYEYDDAGNRVTMRRGQGGLHRFDYGYDAQNQLTQVRETRGRTRRHTAFSYDALGRRVSKSHIEIIEAANSPSRPGIQMPAELVREDTTWFLWNSAVLLAEGKGDENGPVDPLATVYAYEPASFRPAAQIRRVEAEAEAQILIYWLDHLGTPQELSNENGELVWQVALKAWGGVGRTFVERVPQNLRFQGQYYDDETGLHYNRFRHYDPAAGCFLNPDPIGLLGGGRPFSYPENPLVWMDPLGLMCSTDTSSPDASATPKSSGKKVPLDQADKDYLSQIRNDLSITSNRQMGRNVAVGRGHVDGTDIGEVIGVSGAKGPGVAMPSTPSFKTTVDGHPRNLDSEVFVLENIAQKLTPQSRGTITLISERNVCNSCQGGINQFRSKFPGVKLIVRAGA